MFVNKVLTCFYIIIERVFVWFNAFFTQKTDYKNAVGTIDTSLTCFSMLFRYYLPRKVIY